jgi:hypothetical protein
MVGHWRAALLARQQPAIQILPASMSPLNSKSFLTVDSDLEQRSFSHRTNLLRAIDCLCPVPSPAPTAAANPRRPLAAELSGQPRCRRAPATVPIRPLRLSRSCALLPFSSSCDWLSTAAASSRALLVLRRRCSLHLLSQCCDQRLQAGKAPPLTGVRLLEAEPPHGRLWRLAALLPQAQHVGTIVDGTTDHAPLPCPARVHFSFLDNIRGC